MMVNLIINIIRSKSKILPNKHLALKTRRISANSKVADELLSTLGTVSFIDVTEGLLALKALLQIWRSLGFGIMEIISTRGSPNMLQLIVNYLRITYADEVFR